MSILGYKNSDGRCGQIMDKDIVLPEVLPESFDQLIELLLELLG